MDAGLNAEDRDEEIITLVRLINPALPVPRESTMVPMVGTMVGITTPVVLLKNDRIEEMNAMIGAAVAGVMIASSASEIRSMPPIFRQLLYRYKETGEDVYFDIQITNEDPTSSVGRQTVILKDCNLDGGILAKFDADAEYLDEDADFTFEDFEIPEVFGNMSGML